MLDTLQATEYVATSHLLRCTPRYRILLSHRSWRNFVVMCRYYTTYNLIDLVAITLRQALFNRYTAPPDIAALLVIQYLSPVNSGSPLFIGLFRDDFEFSRICRCHNRDVTQAQLMHRLYLLQPTNRRIDNSVTTEQSHVGQRAERQRIELQMTYQAPRFTQRL